ncbi:MAG: hypothetical protein JWR80_485 [Bradyrhizobium sp.]|nr:hypothetical protein [Bradyrhizobium sp.]
MPAKLPGSSSDHSASIPWEGLLSLSAHWAGAGSLYDWIAPPDFFIDRQWTPEIVRARMTEVTLLHIQNGLGSFLPRHAGEWLNVIAQQSHRTTRHIEMPSPHVDWQATIATYGKYPSIGYVERRPTVTHDSGFTRVLKWTVQSVMRAEQFVFEKFARRPLRDTMRRRFQSALELPEIAAAADEIGGLSEYDLDACRYSGGVWLVIAKIAGLLSGLSSGGASSQLMALRPILPEFPHQLFELGVLGTITTGLRVATSPAWTSQAPLAAARGGNPCLSLNAEEGSWRAHYQTIPLEYREKKSPYVFLTEELDGRRLRPDIWITQKVGQKVQEIIIECKYSLQSDYIATGVTQNFAYEVEFPSSPGVARLHVVVGPEDTVRTSCCWKGRFVVTNPSGIRDLCRSAFLGNVSEVMKNWRVAA